MYGSEANGDPRGSVFENDALPRAQDVLKHQLRKNRFGYVLIAQMHEHRLAAGDGFRGDFLSSPAREYQQSALGARLRQRMSASAYRSAFQGRTRPRRLATP